MPLFYMTDAARCTCGRCGTRDQKPKTLPVSDSLKAAAAHADRMAAYIARLKAATIRNHGASK